MRVAFEFRLYHDSQLNSLPLRVLLVSKIQQQAHGLSLRDAMRRIQTHRGLKGYYRGLVIPLLTYGTINAFFFGVYGDVCDYLVKLRAHHQRLFQIIKNQTIYRSPTPDDPDYQVQDTYMETQLDFEPLYGESFVRYPKGVAKNVATSDDKDTAPKDTPVTGDSGDGTNVVEPKEHFPRPSFIEMLIAGTVAGIAQLSLAAPADLVKTKLQSQMKSRTFKGPFDCFIKVACESGYRGIYRGVGPMTIRNLAGSGINFTVICSVMHLCDEDLAPTSMVQTCVATGLAGAASWWLVLPFDVIKTRLQADDHKFPVYRNMLHCAKDIVLTEGIVGLYRGFWSCTARAFPVNAATFLVHEYYHSKYCEEED